MQTFEMPDDDPLGNHFFSISLYTITDAFALTIGCSLHTKNNNTLCVSSHNKIRRFLQRPRSVVCELIPSELTMDK